MTEPLARRGAASEDPFDVTEAFRRFSQKDDIFCRAFWDPEVHSPKTDRFFATYREPLAGWRGADGFTQRDYALRNASWHVTDLFAEAREGDDRREGYLDPFTALRDGPAEKAAFESPAAASAEIKRVAKLFGADLVGIAPLDERWVYTRRYSRQREDEKPNDVATGMTHVIVIAREMDAGLIDTVPSALSGAATGWGYSEDTATLLAVSQYVRNLGYSATPTLNDSALAIPFAILAGLGEYGRHGMVITPEFGPRVRFGKIFTDLPMLVDRPIRFGVTEFCEICRRCTDACPVGAIPDGAPAEVVHNRSNIQGVRKWTVDAESCFGFWTRQNSDCSICIRVCPYHQRWSRRWMERWVRLAGSPLRRFALYLAGRFGSGRRVAASTWWRRPVP